jgi:hypothetical protein
MKKVFETFLIVFFFCHGAASIALMALIGDMMTAYYTSMALSAVAGLVAIGVDYIKYMKRKDSPFREDVIDDEMIEVNKEIKKKEKEAEEA